MAQHKITLFPQSTTSPNAGGNAFDTINTTSGFASESAFSDGSASATARWFNFSTNFQGMGPNDIQLIVGSFNWSAGGNADITVNTDGFGGANASATGDIFGGVSGSAGFFDGCGVSLSGPGPISDHDDFNSGDTETATFTPNTLASITGAQCTASVSCDASADNDASSSSDVVLGLDSISITVTLTDWMVIAC